MRKFANLKNGGNNIQMDILHALLNSFSLKQRAYLATLGCKKVVISVKVLKTIDKI